MKRLFIPTIIFILIIQSSNCQTYYPLPENNAYWQYTMHDIPMLCECNGHCFHEQLKITGDTMINDQVYHKLFKTGLYLDDNCDEIFYSAGYQGAFRNETETKTVWFVPEGETEEGLLYEFDLEIGDTLSTSLLTQNYGWNFWVEDIDTVEIGNTFRKQFIIRSELNTSEMPLFITEGIGGQNLIEPMESWYCFEAGYTRRCFNSNDTLIIPSNCEIITSEQESTVGNEFILYPNPTSGKIWIKTLTGNKAPGLIEVFDIYGQSVQGFGFNETSNYLNFSSLPKGLYIVYLQSKTQCCQTKIVLK